ELDDGVGEAALVEHALPQILDEGRTLYELHREEAVLVTDEQLVQLHETRVSDVGERPELLFEEVQLGRIPAAERLQGDLGARLEVVDAIHHAHAAAAELFEQAESCVAREHPLAARGSTGESRGSLGRLSRLAQEVEVETPPRDATAGERGDRIGVVEDQLANLECTLVAVRRVTPD